MATLLVTYTPNSNFSKHIITTQTCTFTLVTMVIKYFNEWRAQGGLLSSLNADIDTII